LIVDECHRAGSPVNSLALIQDCAATIGLSATPYREYDEGFQDLVSPILGPIVAKYSLQESIKDGVLASLRLRNVRIPLLPSEQDDYDKITRAIGKAFADNESQERIRNLLIRRARLANNAYFRVPIASTLVSNYPGKRILVFLESIKTSQDLFEALNRKGISVAIYHSKMGTHLRRANLRGFRRGIFDVLIACRALDEGFNVPEAEVAIIAAGTASKRQRVQRIGRVLRSFGEKVSGTVVTLYATAHEETRLQSECEVFKGIVPVEWAEVNLGK
jgi:superfamily II DNA or RNA helicase